MPTRHFLRWFATVGISCLLLTGSGTAQVVLHSFPLHNLQEFPVRIGDVDGDGVTDLAIRRWNWPVAGQVDVYSMRSGALVRQFVPTAGSTFDILSAVGDVDGDGRDDFSIVESVGASSTSVVRSGATGQVVYTHAVPNTTVLFLSDLTGDGRAELLVSDRDATSNGLTLAGRVDALASGSGQVLWSHVGSVALEFLHAQRVFGDLDGDGKVDYLLFGSQRAAGFSGATGAQLFSLPQATNAILHVVDVGDFNADGIGDVVREYAYTYSNPYPPPGGTATVYANSYHVLAGPTMSQVLGTWYCSSTTSLPFYGLPHGRIGDVDGDGHDDLALHGGFFVSTSMFSGRNNGYLMGLSYGLMPLAGSPGDVDGDGFVDALSWGTGSYWAHLVSIAPAGVTRNGVGCAGPSGHSPGIGVGRGAHLGGTMTVNLNGAAPNLVGAVLVGGTDDQSWGGVPLPLDLQAFGMPGCLWRVAPSVLLGMPTGGGPGQPRNAQHEVLVPASPSLVGTTVHWQWLVLEPGPGGLAGSISPAVRTTVVQ